MLVGSDDGLFVSDLTKNTSNRPLTKVTGVTTVYQMSVIAHLHLVVMITGKYWNTRQTAEIF